VISARSCVALCVWAAVGAALAGGLAACRSGPEQHTRAARGTLPTYAEIVAKYNTRCKGLERVRAPVTLTIEAKDDTGKIERNQLEANLQVILPSKLSVRVDKVGQTLCLLGSDDTRYWWIDLSEEPIAYVGTHAKTSPGVARKFGIPVHPLDLIEALGITPLPEKEPLAKVAWGEPGQVVVSLPPRAKGWGGRRIHIETETWKPTRIEALEPGGEIAASATLSRFIQVFVAEDRFSPARMASRYSVALPRHEATVAMAVPTPENPGSTMRTRSFELDALLKAYQVDASRVIDLDAEKPR